MKLQKFLLWLMSLAFAVCVCGCKDDDNSAEPNYKVVNGQLFQTTDGDTWQYVGKVIGDSVSNSLFKIDGEFLMVSTDGTSWRSLGTVVGSNGVTPLFDIKDGYWCVSYDNGKTWEKKDKATTEVSGGGVSKDTTSGTNNNSALCDANLVWGKFFYEYWKDGSLDLYEFREDGKFYRSHIYYVDVHMDTYEYFEDKDTAEYICEGKTIYVKSIFQGDYGVESYVRRWFLLNDGEHYYVTQDYEMAIYDTQKGFNFVVNNDNLYGYYIATSKSEAEKLISTARKEIKQKVEELNKKTAENVGENP